MYMFFSGIVASKSVLPRWRARGSRHLPGHVGATRGGTSRRSEEVKRNTAARGTVAFATSGHSLNFSD